MGDLDTECSSSQESSIKIFVGKLGSLTRTVSASQRKTPRMEHKQRTKARLILSTLSLNQPSTKRTWLPPWPRNTISTSDGFRFTVPCVQQLLEKLQPHKAVGPDGVQSPPPPPSYTTLRYLGQDKWLDLNPPVQTSSASLYQKNRFSKVNSVLWSTPRYSNMVDPVPNLYQRHNSWYWLQDEALCRRQHNLPGDSLPPRQS